MKIALVNPNRDLKDAAVHLGLGYIASYARAQHNDLDICVLDTRISSKQQVEKFLNRQYDMVGITASSQVFTEAFEIASFIKDKYPDSKVCLGGSHASTYLGESLENNRFDYAVYGEGEVTFSELISFLKGKKKLPDINGLIYRDSSGDIKTNPSRSLIKNIDAIPLPAFDLFKMSKYPQHRIVTSRGCPFNCVFCNSSAIWTNRWRKRSVNNLVAEIDLLLHSFGRKTVVFNDDSFNIDGKRVIELCDNLISRKTNILWSSSVRVDLVTPEIASKLKMSGCYNVSIGIESANNQVLEKINKNTTKEKILNGIMILRNAGIDVMGQFMIGNPGDSLETVKESIAFAESSPLTGVEFYTALPYRGSLLWDYVLSHGQLLTDTEPYNYHNVSPRIIFDTPDFPYRDRLAAVNLVKDKGYYNALSTDKRQWKLDAGRSVARLFQSLLGGGAGNRFYLWLRRVYSRSKTSKPLKHENISRKQQG